MSNLLEFTIYFTLSMIIIGIILIILSGIIYKFTNDMDGPELTPHVLAIGLSIVLTGVIFLLPALFLFPII